MNIRYERKFVVSDITLNQLGSLIKTHPFFFFEIYPARFVNNIYFDSFNLENYFDRISGASNSVKIRIRWYGELFGYIEKPFLEIKTKEALIGDKKRFLLPSFSLGSDFTLNKIQQVFLNSDIPEFLKAQLMTMECTLLNHFKRKYFQSVNKDFMLTIDSEITYYAIRTGENTFLNKSVETSVLVLEIKYPPDMDDIASNITNFLPFRLSRNSKYINGIEKIYGW
jgi:hypothetical protein